MLYKVVEGWRQKELERHEVVSQLQLEKHSLQQAVESQQQVSDNLAWSWYVINLLSVPCVRTKFASRGFSVELARSWHLRLFLYPYLPSPS